MPKQRVAEVKQTSGYAACIHQVSRKDEERQRNKAEAVRRDNEFLSEAYHRHVVLDKEPQRRKTQRECNGNSKRDKQEH